MRLKPSGLRCVDIWGNFNAVLRFCYVILCGVYIPAFLCGFAVFLCYSVRCLYTGISVPFCGVRTLLTFPPLFRLLSDLKFYFM